ncbi:MAG: SDR family oxidoreductase [Spirochaetia bacterium]|jgi:nucleoside-diphosphate-sugar epimerase
MKALFIGGTGLISSAVSRLAVERGIELTLLNRGQKGEFFPPGAHQIVADMGDLAAVRAALQDRSFDVVTDWIAFTPDQAARDIELFSGRTNQFIFISSASAYQKPPSNYLITESTPVANPYWQYSRDKIACEDLLMREHREKGFPITIVRPSHTYGVTQIPAAVGSWNHPWTLVDRMRRGRKIVVPGDGTSLWTMTHNSDFAKGFVGLMGNVRAIGHTFHITSDEVLTWNQIYNLIGAAAGVRPDIVHLASDFIAAFNPEDLGGLTGDKANCGVFDNTKIKTFVPGYVATVPFAEGIRESVQWFEKHPERRTIDESFNSVCDRMIDANETALRAAAVIG